MQLNETARRRDRQLTPPSCLVPREIYHRAGSPSDHSAVHEGQLFGHHLEIGKIYSQTGACHSMARCIGRLVQPHFHEGWGATQCRRSIRSWRAVT